MKRLLLIILIVAALGQTWWLIQNRLTKQEPYLTGNKEQQFDQTRYTSNKNIDNVMLLGMAEQPSTDKCFYFSVLHHPRGK